MDDWQKDRVIRNQADEIHTKTARIAELEAEVARLTVLLGKQDKARERNGWNDAIEAAAAKAESHPMRFAGMTEEFVRKEMSAAIRAIRR